MRLTVSIGRRGFLHRLVGPNELLPDKMDGASHLGSWICIIREVAAARNDRDLDAGRRCSFWWRGYRLHTITSTAAVLIVHCSFEPVECGPEARRLRALEPRLAVGLGRSTKYEHNTSVSPLMPGLRVLRLLGSGHLRLAYLDAGRT